MRVVFTSGGTLREFAGETPVERTVEGVPTAFQATGGIADGDDEPTDASSVQGGASEALRR